MTDRIKIILAESCVEDRIALQQALEDSERFQICGSTGDGTQVPALLEENSPDLLFLDLMLPNLDGFGILRRIDKKYMRILAVSSFISPCVSEAAEKLGTDVLLSKPYETRSMVDNLIWLYEHGGDNDGWRAAEDSVADLLQEFGMYPHIRGYHYALEAILRTLEEPDLIHAMTTSLYPSVAEVFDTTAASVERAIRNAISRAWEHCSPKLRAAYGDKRPSNSVLIATISEWVRVEMDRSLPTSENTDSRFSIILADPQESTMYALKTTLESTGRFRVLAIVSNGDQLVDALLMQDPDVVLVDLCLPGLANAKLQAELSAEHGPSVLVSTIDSCPSVTDMAKKLGASMLLNKPYCPDAVIDSLLSLARERGEMPQLRRIKLTISEILTQAGISPSSTGFPFLREAVRLVLQDPRLIHAMTTELYPTVASRFNTSPQRVERNIRHAIQIGWESGRGSAFYRFLGYAPPGDMPKPTNRTFIFLVAEYIRSLQEHQGQH